MRNLSLRRFEDAANNKPRSCMLFDIVTRKNAALPIFTVPRCAAPGMRRGTLAMSLESSHAVDSTSAATVVGTGMPIFDTCASRKRVAHDCDLTSTLSKACVCDASSVVLPWRSYWRRLFGSLRTA